MEFNYQLNLIRLCAKHGVITEKTIINEELNFASKETQDNGKANPLMSTSSVITGSKTVQWKGCCLS